MEIKSINPANLKVVRNYDKITSMMNTATNTLLENEKKKDVLYRIMTDDQSQDELFGFVDRLIVCLATDKIFPPDQSKIDDYEKADIQQVHARLLTIKNTKNMLYARALIWCGLRISSSFVAVFCPPPDPRVNGKFLVNPEKMEYMIKGNQHTKITTENPHATIHQPLRCNISRFINGRDDISDMVAKCIVDWTSLAPWKDNARLETMSPNTPSQSLIRSQLSNTRKTLDAGARTIEDRPEHAYVDWE